MKKRLHGKVALITGASRGLGAAIAKRFAQEGAELLLLARSVSELEKIDDMVRPLGSQATLIPYDLNNWMGLEQLIYPVLENIGRLDILVANAAQLGTLGPVAQGTPEEWERLFRVNVLANWQLLRIFDPLLRASPSGRVIAVTDSPPPDTSYWGSYYSSKAALDQMILTYAHEVAHTSVRVNLVDPGPMDTNLRRLAFPGENKQRLASPDDLTESFVALSDESCQQHGKIVHLEKQTKAA